MIYSDLELEELAELVGVGSINGIPCKCLIDTGANRTTVPASLIQTHQYTGKTEKAMLANRDMTFSKGPRSNCKEIELPSQWLFLL